MLKKLTFLLLLSLISISALALDRTKIQEDAKDVTPLLDGMQVPKATVKNAEGDPLSLQALLMQKPSVVIFYRGGWCPYCSRQLAELKNIETDLLDAGYQIIAISPESPEKLQAQKLKTEFAAQLISDDRLQAISGFGVGFYVPDNARQRMKEKADIDLIADTTERAVLPAPAVFIVDTTGTVLFSYVNPDYAVRPSADMILSVAKALL